MSVTYRLAHDVARDVKPAKVGKLKAPVQMVQDRVHSS